MNCSFSPQISDSKAEPPAVKRQTTSHERPAKRSLSPTCVSMKRPERRLPTHTSARPETGRCPSTTCTFARTVHAWSLMPRTTTLPTAALS
jgi:hypothetical protein